MDIVHKIASGGCGCIVVAIIVAFIVYAIKAGMCERRGPSSPRRPHVMHPQRHASAGNLSSAPRAASASAL